MQQIKTKICTKCETEKSLTEFGRDKRMLLGLKSRCKICDNACCKDYRKKNKNKVRASKKIYYEANKEKISIYMKVYRKNNKKKMRTVYNIWRDQKRKTDFKFKLNDSISKAIRKSLKDGKNGHHWEFLVNYTLKKLRKHLEKQFTDGMSWDNYGFYGWHIDHKIPISAFNFTKSGHRDFKRCWALSNLRPLWATKNKEKTNKISKHFQPSLLI